MKNLVFFLLFVLFSSLLPAEDSAIYVDVSGNVGVGTEAPSAVLDVSGDVKISELLTLPPQASAPENPENGSIYLSDDGRLNVYFNGSWRGLAFLADEGNVEGGPEVNEYFQILIKTDNAGISGPSEFRLPLSSSHNYHFEVDWGDGQIEEISTNEDVTHTYSTPGEYVVKIKELSQYGFPTVFFHNRDDEKLLEIQNWGANTWTSMHRSFWGCSEMKITAEDLPNTSQVTDFYSAFRECTSLFSFPMIDTSSALTLNETWRDCSNLLSFPQIVSSNVTSFSGAWRSCSSMVNFPLIDTQKAITLKNAWYFNSSLTNFPQINSANVTDFSRAWDNCTSLTEFPLIDTSEGTNFAWTWRSNRGLTTFPAIDTGKAINLNETWNHCDSMTTFPFINTSNVTNFVRTWNLNRRLSSFPEIDMSNGTNFQSTFYRVNRNLAFPALDLSSAVHAKDFLLYSEMDTVTYSNLLIDLEANNQNDNVIFGGGYSKFNTAGAVARQALIDDHGWTFSDGGLE